MPVRKFALSALLCTTLLATPAQPAGCEDVAAGVLKFLVSTFGSTDLKNAAKAQKIVDAWDKSEEGQGSEAIAKTLAEMGVTMTFGFGAKVLIGTGKTYVNGIEWTVAEAERAQTEAFLCGGVSSGSGIRVESAFDLRRAQQDWPRITCQNYPDWLDTPAKFAAFRDYFKGYYSRTTGEMGLSQGLLDRQWAVIENTWHAREAEREMRRLQAALQKYLEEGPKPACPLTPPPPPELGADNSDPAKLPEPDLPPGGMLVLVETVVTPHSLDPSITHSAAPQRNALSAYWGESACVWSAPPKALVSEEVFGFDFSLSVGSKNQQRYAESMVVRTGFANVDSLPNELAVSVEPGGGKSATGHLELGTGDLAGAQDYMTWYLSVGGCGGNVDYIYKFRKP